MKKILIFILVNYLPRLLCCIVFCTLCNSNTSIAQHNADVRRSDSNTFTALCNLGAEQQISGNYTQAVESYILALSYAKLPEDKQRLHIAYSGIGIACSSQSKYDSALSYFNRSLSALKDVKKIKISASDSSTVYGHVGAVWVAIGEPSYAISSYLQAETIASRNKDTNTLIATYMNVASAYTSNNNLAQAEAYYKKALAMPGFVSAEKHVIILIGLATVRDRMDDNHKALIYLDKAATIVTRWKLPERVAVRLQATQGIVYLHMKKYNEARTLLDSALAQAKVIGQSDLLESLELNLAKVNAALGYYDEAYGHLIEYSDIKDSVYENEKSRSLEIVIGNNIAEKNMAMIKQQLHITNQETSLQHRNIWIASIAAGILLLVAVGAGVVFNYRNKHAMQRAQIYQIKQTQEINQLKAQVRGEEQERQRIARELHDSIASQLWAVNLNVESFQQLNYDDEAYSKNLNSIFQQLTDVAQDVRKTAQNLMPDLLLQKGLATALASVCEKTKLNTRLDVSFQEYGVVPAMDKEIELSIYRMVQELIQNALKHAKDANSLLVQISCIDTLLGITVEDNGVIIAKRARKDGIGLQQIRKRVQSMKGNFDLQSIPGKGTTAYIEFDLQHLY